MTKKKDPSQLKKRGAKEEIMNNEVLYTLLSEVTEMNQLTGKARLLISNTIKNTLGNSRHAYAPRKIILGIVKINKEISLDTIRKSINGTELFQKFAFSPESVKKYKRVTIAVIKVLLEALNSGVPILKEQPNASDYLDAEEAKELSHKIRDGKTRFEMIELLLNGMPEEEIGDYLQELLNNYGTTE